VRYKKEKEIRLRDERDFRIEDASKTRTSEEAAAIKGS
jgi:hypothetical protein